MARLKITRMTVVEDVVDSQFYKHDDGTEWTIEEITKHEQNMEGEDFFDAVVSASETLLTMTQVKVLDEEDH